MKKEKLYRKIICSAIITCFLTLSINPSLADLKNSEKPIPLCYGFIVSPITNGNFTTMDQINCKIRHMINDLLREEILIYWTAENINVKVKKINSRLVYENRLFESGSFIIPFTGNLTNDNKIITIIYDYNQSSEIEINNVLKVPICLILEQISTQVFPLNNVKIALFYSRISVSEYVYLDLISKCGFLNYEIIKDKKINKDLKVEKFNVLIHPGEIGGADYEYFFKFFHKICTDLFLGTSDGVRFFVEKGGGYIGSCAGLLRAGAGGKVPFPVYLKRRVYNPDLKSIGFYAIADILIRSCPKLPHDIQIKINNSLSPITYSLDEIVWDTWFGGPEVYHTGENAEVIADFYNTGTRVDGRPAWITAKFGDGKIAIFSTHPEIAGMLENPTYESQSNTGKTVISNSLFYTTSGEKIEYKIGFSKNLTYIYDIWEKTADLTKNIIEIERILDPIRDRINNTKEFIDYLTGNLSEVISLIDDIAKENKVDLTDYHNKYYLGLDYIKDVKKFHFEYFKEFLNDSNIVFNKIELIHELLKNDTNFQSQIKTLIINLSDRLNEINRILKNGQVMIDAYKQHLLKYQEQKSRSIIKKNQLKMDGNTIYIHIFLGFSQIPKIYFDPLIFLRHHWYNYETSIAH